MTTIAPVDDALLDALRSAEGAPLAYAEPPHRLTGGRDTEVYALRLVTSDARLAGPLVLRVFRAGEEQRAASEAATQSALAEAGAPVPAVLARGTLGQRPFMLMERVPGCTAAACLIPPQRVTFRIPRLLGEAHAALHGTPLTPVEAAVARSGRPLRRPLDFARDVTRLPADDARRGAAVLAWLGANAPPAAPDVLCHGDFHPLNVLIDAGRVAGLIDWANVAVAPAEYDVACALVLLVDAPATVPRWVRPLEGAIRRLLAARYLAAYRRRRTLDDALVRYCTVLFATSVLIEARGAARVGRGHAWRDPVAARRLVARIGRITGLDASELLEGAP